MIYEKSVHEVLNQNDGEPRQISLIILMKTENKGHREGQIDFFTVN